MESAAASVSAKFSGFTPASRADSPKAFPAVNSSMVAIHLGIGGSSPSLGRPLHWRTDSKRNSRPSNSLSTYARVDGVPPAEILPRLARTSTMLPTAARAKTQPSRKAEPLLLARWLNSIKMTAMIGTGLMATPIAWGKIVPIAFPMTSFLRVVLERGMVRYVSRNLPLSSGPLLPRHRHVEQVFRPDEMV